MSASNHHATAIVVGETGILIRGPSGSGKTTLALAALSWAHAAGHASALVSDDQVLLSASSGRLVCTAPESIAGLVEVRGRRPQRIRHEPSAVVHLVIDLVEQAVAPRFSDDRTISIEGCEVALLVLEKANVSGAFAPLASWLGLPPFDITATPKV